MPPNNDDFIPDDDFVPDKPAKKVDPRFVDDEPAAPVRTFEPTPDLVGQFHRMRAELDAQPTRMQRVTNVLGNATTLGAGPAINAAGQKLASLLPGQEPVDYSAVRRANQQRLDEDRAALGRPASLALETVGGIVPALIAPEAKAAQALSPVARGVAAGGTFGGAQALGETASRGDWENLGKNLAVGTAIGGATGGVLGGVANRIVEGAPKNVDNWLVNDILGSDIKTQANATSRKVLAQDEADLIHTVKDDPALRRQIDKARGGDSQHLTKLQQAIQDRKAATFAPRQELYEALDESHPQGGARVGDFVDAVEDANKGNMRTGFTKERNALAQVADSLRKFEGADFVIDPAAEVVPGFPATKAVQLKEAELARTTDPIARKTVESDLAQLKQQFGREVYNPDKVIPTEEMRDVLTRLQGDVRDALGGLNEKASYRRAKEVVAPIWQAFDEHLNGGDPQIVEAIRNMNRKGSALLNMEDVVKQRLNRATQQDLTVQRAPSSLRAIARNTGGITGGAIMAGMGHPVIGAGMAASAAIPEIRRGAEKALVDLVMASKRPGAAGVLPGLVLDAIQKGVPRSVAMQFAGSATGGEIHNALPGGP